MKILIACDKFKGSLSARAVGEAIRKGLNKQSSNIEIILHPMADGGDGSLEILSQHLDLKKEFIKTSNPLGKKIDASYYTSSEAAFIEVASASGLVLLSETERNPLKTSTFGTGLLIKNAFQKGFSNIFLFLGGSATNDAGIGIASALGFEFSDSNKNALHPIGKNLNHIYSIVNNSLFDFNEINITLLCDVNNPLFGKNGAAYVYAPQKGASPAQVEFLDKGLENYHAVLQHYTGKDIQNLAGCGAAGGIPASLVALMNAQLQSGFSTISQLTKLENAIKNADLVISGEGKLDSQSLQGKVIDGLAQLCKKYKKSLVLCVGKNDLSEKETEALSIKKIHSIFDEAKNLEDAMQNGAVYLEKIGERIKA